MRGSAGAGLRFAFDRNAVVSVPAFLADAGYASFVRGGDPVPIYALQITPMLLELNKIMTGTVLTREMLNGCPANVGNQDPGCAEAMHSARARFCDV